MNLNQVLAVIFLDYLLLGILLSLAVAAVIVVARFIGAILAKREID